MLANLLFTLALFYTMTPALAVLGVDLSAPFNNFACLKDLGYTFAIPRGYRSYGAVDVDGFNNVKNSKAAGLITDVYFFPCKGSIK